MNDGLLGFLRKYGQAGLDKLEELKAQGQGYASQVDEYFGITPKPDPRSIPPRPIVDRGPLAGPENNILRDNPLMEALDVRKPDQPTPNTYFGQPVVPSEEPFKPMAQRWETATKKAFPMGSMNLVNPLPPEQNRAAIRAALPGPQG